MVVEKREQAERDRCAIAASVRIVEKDEAVPCLIVDLTERGAGLFLESTVELPARFHLVLPLTDEDIDERLVELRWRRGSAAGVLFVRP